MVHYLPWHNTVLHENARAYSWNTVKTRIIGNLAEKLEFASPSKVLLSQLRNIFAVFSPLNPRGKVPDVLELLSIIIVLTVERTTDEDMKRWYDWHVL